MITLIQDDVLFDYDLENNPITHDLVSKVSLAMHDHPHPFPLGWVNKGVEIKVIKQCKSIFSTNTCLLMRWKLI
jgi:hypothetical protein